MGQPLDKSSKIHEKHEPADEFIRQADKAGQAFVHEVQKDWQSGCKWVKEHPRQDGLIVGGAIIVGGAALWIKDKKDGAAAIAEGNRLMSGRQVLNEATFFEKSGVDGQLSTQIKFGNNSESSFLIDPASAQGRRLMEQRSSEGLSNFLPKVVKTKPESSSFKNWMQ